MTAPNLRDPESVIGRTVGYAVTTSLQTAIENPAASGLALRINAIYCANINSGLSVDIALVRRRGGVDRHLCSNLVVPVGATQVLVAREAYVYLEEGDSFLARAGAANSLELLIGYEEIS
jgi:hypothetical protein